MSLTAADVAEILRVLEESSFDELDLEINGVKLSLRRGSAASGEEALNRRAARSGARATATSGSAATSGSGATTATTTSTPSAANSSATQKSAPNSAATHADPNLHDVPSPLLGTFYRSPKPGAPPFVEVGSAVAEDTIVAIIEVMKLMNTVRAGARGTVAEILPSDGSLVEYDQPILRIRKSG